MKQKLKGFTLVEIAIILVILGLLIGIGASLIGVLIKRAKINETREIVDAAVEALISHAAGSKCLIAGNDSLSGPLNGTTLSQNAGIRKAYDAWNQPLRYFLAREVANSTNGNCTPYLQDICGRRGTSLTLKICQDSACTLYQSYSNIAFVIVSGGPNYNVQIDNRTEVNVIRIYAPGTRDVDNFPYDINRPEEFDDIVKWVTLDELRVKMGCPGAQLRIITTELPTARQGDYYEARILAEGGWPPISWTITGLPLGLLHGPDPNDSYNKRTYLINGTPQCPGAFTIQVNATDNNTNNASKSFTLVVQPNPLYLSPIPGTTFYVRNGDFFNKTITASGGRPPYLGNCNTTLSYCLNSTGVKIPPHMFNVTCNSTKDTSNNTIITIFGTPNSTGTCFFNVSFSDNSSANCTGSFNQTINATYTVEIYSLPGGDRCASYTVILDTNNCKFYKIDSSTCQTSSSATVYPGQTIHVYADLHCNAHKNSYSFSVLSTIDNNGNCIVRVSGSGCDASDY